MCDSASEGLREIEWRRLVLDECHDAVLLNYGQSMQKLLAIKAKNVWCVTGTPFPRGDDSAWGINQVRSGPSTLHVVGSRLLDDPVGVSDAAHSH